MANEGYKIVECTNNSFVAGTVTELTSSDCNHVAVRHQVPIFGNIVKIISTGTKISIPLAAVDTDKDYLTYKLASQPTYGVTGLGNNAPLTTNTDGKTSQVPYDPPNPPVSDSFRVSVTDKRDGHTREALISIVGPTPGPTISDAVDDLSYTINGNTITLSWTHPSDGGSEITSYRIERSINTNTWSLVNTISETLTSYDVTSSPGSITYYRILVNNAHGQSGSSNIVQPYITDTTPPTITISTPTTNQVVNTQNIHVISNIFENQNTGIENIQMTMDHVLTTDPISVSRIGIITATATSEITEVDNGQRTLTVRATNGDGYVGSTSVSFTKNTPTSQNLSSFEDNFESNIASNWHRTTGDDEYWDIRTPTVTVPGSTTGNKVAGTEDCDDQCELIMIHTVNTSAMTEPKLSFYRYLSTSLDSGEGLDVSVSTDGGTTFTILDSFTADSSEDDNTWHLQEYSLTNYTSTQFKIKFIATSSSN
ncbi:MAG: fibronectin type III domain-containing protein [Nitrosopumilus sp.]|nr:fibronectin type III domain-containing protein [Nitrosopumilus sp.]NRA05533.1 fibronectin type III domain-containing protein [Nitrosopumilus sp.]